MAHLPTPTLPIFHLQMPRIETRITSVQIVPGFPARLTILDPPGWDVPPPQPSPNIRGYPDARIEHTSYALAVRHPRHYSQSTSPRQIEYFKGDVHSGSDGHPSPAVSPAHTLTIALQPTRGTEVETPKIGETEAFQRRFYQRKLSHEPLFLNFIVSRGGWADEPPAFLDFSSCKDGPIFYVNEVKDKKVNQIWKWDMRWVSVQEGDIFRTTERDRVLKLDGNRVPRLTVVRRPRIKARTNTGA